jgi:hypothetical protein
MTTTDALKYLPQMGLNPLKVVGCAAAKCQTLLPWRVDLPSKQSLERETPSASSVRLTATSTKSR